MTRTYRYETIKRIQRNIVESLENIYKNTERFQWSSKELSEAYSKHVLNNPEYARLPVYSQFYITGIRDYLDRQLWKSLVFSYEIKGKRLRLNTPEYRKIDPCYVNEHCSDSGCFVYSDSPHKEFTLPKSTDLD